MVPGMAKETGSGAMQLQVNGKAKTVPEGISVKELLDLLELLPGTVVVELNREILERKSFPEVILHEGDMVEIVHFVGGGAPQAG